MSGLVALTWSRFVSRSGHWTPYFRVIFGPAHCLCNNRLFQVRPYPCLFAKSLHFWKILSLWWIIGRWNYILTDLLSGGGGGTFMGYWNGFGGVAAILRSSSGENCRRKNWWTPKRRRTAKVNWKSEGQTSKFFIKIRIHRHNTIRIYPEPTIRPSRTDLRLLHGPIYHFHSGDFYRKSRMQSSFLSRFHNFHIQPIKSWYIRSLNWKQFHIFIRNALSTFSENERTNVR